MVSGKDISYSKAVQRSQSLQKEFCKQPISIEWAAGSVGWQWLQWIGVRETCEIANDLRQCLGARSWVARALRQLVLDKIKLVRRFHRLRLPQRVQGGSENKYRRCV